MADVNENVTIENGAESTVKETKVEKAQESKQEQVLSVEEQLQKLMVENEKLRRATDKATSEASSYKKQLRAKQSEDEIALQEKAEREAEREEQFNALVRENAINKLEKNFALLGYSAEQATKAAEAQYDGETDVLFKIQQEVQNGLLKAKEAEWLASRPPVNAGVEGENPNISKEQFNKMGYLERVEFAEKYPKSYEAYTKA